MKKLLLSLVTAAAVLMPCASPATELTGLYIAPKFVLNVQHTKTEVSLPEGRFSLGDKTGVRAGGAFAVGYDFALQFNVPVRAELEYGIYGNVSHFRGLAKDVDFKSTAGIQTLLANVYWDITEWNDFKPYVGVGAGLAFLKTEGRFNVSQEIGQRHPEMLVPWHDTDTVFAGQVGLGFSYAFTESVSADFGYRFLMLDDGDARHTPLTQYSKENRVHQVMLGLRVTF